MFECRKRTTSLFPHIAETEIIAKVHALFDLTQADIELLEANI
jgi:hypothetical protein